MTVRDDVWSYQTAVVGRKGDRIVVLGYPQRDDDMHNCDALGCGRDHVLATATIANDGGLLHDPFYLGYDGVLWHALDGDDPGLTLCGGTGGDGWKETRHTASSPTRPVCSERLVRP